MVEVILRDIKLDDLKDYLEMNDPSKKFHQFNGPYFKQRTKKELENLVKTIESKLIQNKQKDTKKGTNILENKKLIADSNTDKIIGEVNWYWKSEETLWMEIGIVIFNEDYWKKGIGTKAFKYG